jgi:hypothetical protein
MCRGVCPEGWRLVEKKILITAKAKKRNGRHEETRTPDLYRVNFEVLNLKPFSSLAFPVSQRLKTSLNQLSFGDELVTSLRALQREGITAHLVESFFRA